MFICHNVEGVHGQRKVPLLYTRLFSQTLALLAALEHPKADDPFTDQWRGHLPLENLHQRTEKEEVQGCFASI